MRTLLRSVIQNATVTAVTSGWPVRLFVDVFVLRAAEILAFERIEVVNVTTGARFQTWVEPAAEGSGEVSLHAGSEHPVRRGDVISLIATVSLHEGQTLTHKARFVTLDAANRVIEAIERGARTE